MIQSMTGFGKTTCETEDKKIIFEIKSLNSKQLDVSARLPNSYKEKEIEFRNILSQKLERGKIEFFMYVENIGKEQTSQLNRSAIENYYKQMKEISEQLGIALPSDWFAVLLRLPDSIKTDSEDIKEEEWHVIQDMFLKAVDQLVAYRQREGNSLQVVFESKIANIRDLLKMIEPFEKERIEKIRIRIEEHLASLKDVDYDKNRFEQELIYYIEKLDINEEKSRLQHHLSYFEETMQTEKSPGKKLGFITQEIGREINTLGSKSNNSEMQKIIVKMKDELEQIKEQVLNVL